MNQFQEAVTVPDRSKSARLKSARIRGFRSLEDVTLSNLGNSTVLIGANGSGKSNFMRFFEMLSWMLRSQRLAQFIERYGGADDQLFGGRRTTPAMQAELVLENDSGKNDYRFTLAHVHPDRFMFTEEEFRFSSWDKPTLANWSPLGGGHREALIVEAANSWAGLNVNPKTARVIVHLLRNCAVYQFHDTSNASNFMVKWDVGDNNGLRSDGGNLAAVLFRLENEDHDRFERICRHISRILPVFDRFQIEETYGKVQLRWQAKGTDKTFGAHLTSDGSLRFFALVTLLNLPKELLPSVLLLDEPELGLHPSAVALIGGMIKKLSHDLQTIVATQSPLLVDVFDLEEIIVLEEEEGATIVQKIKYDEYCSWLERGFTPGELWQKNLFGGHP